MHIRMHIRMHQDVAQDYNTALIHLMYVFLAKGIILAHFLLLGSDSPGFAREAFWCVSFIATGMELLFYREQQNVVYMGSLVAVSFADAVVLKYAFYDDFATDKLLLWVTAAVVLSKGFFFRTKPFLPTVNFALLVGLIYLREREELQASLIHHIIPLFCFMQSVKFISIATAKQILKKPDKRTRRGQNTIILKVCLASFLSIISLFLAFIVSEKIVTSNVGFFNLFATTSNIIFTTGHEAKVE
jgi:hypothetical protein